MTSKYVPDAHESTGLVRRPPRGDQRGQTAGIDLAALDALIRHLEANGTPTVARAVKRKLVESYFARRRDEVKPAMQTS
jgi:hypothetical protein